MKKIIFSLAILGICGNTLFAQRKSIKDTIELESVVISGNKFQEKKKNVAQQIDVINAKEIKKLNVSSTADLLIQSGQIFVQKSQQGGGSPVIRGFEASRVLLMIDGIRLNNAIYRSGHLQNIITMDQNALERIEILSGPASTLFGSDALGGVVMLKTKEPLLSKGLRLQLNQANALLRYASANHEKTIGANFGLGNRYWGSFTNITVSDFASLRQGGWDPNKQLQYWGRNYIVARNNNTDQMVKNNNPLIQKESSYQQLDLLQKINYIPDASNKHSLNLQYSTSSNVPRYDRLTELDNNGILKNAEWYYGPQKRSLIAYQYDYTGRHQLLDEFMFNLSYQGIEESRNNRKFNSNILQHRKENVNVYGLNMAARKKWLANELTYGGDIQLNTLQSTAYGENIISNAQSALETRYPDGANKMNLSGIFFQHIYKFKGGQWILNDGLRLSHSFLHSTLNKNYFNLPFTDIRQNNSALTGNAGIIFLPSNEVRWRLNYARGFRSPNFDDMTKIFESQSGARLIVPNQNLKAEFTNNLDFGFTYQDKTFYFNAFVFYTWFKNAIVTDEFTYNGQDSIFYDGSMTKVYASQNKDEAYLYGAGFEFRYKPSRFWQINANTAYTYGRYIQNNGVEIPLDHIAPVYGRASVQYAKDKWMNEFYLLFNGAKELKDYNPNGEDNLQFALATGTPWWYTLNWRLSYAIDKNFNAQLGIDNILDRNYRYFASGISAPGRNVILSVRYSK